MVSSDLMPLLRLFVVTLGCLSAASCLDIDRPDCEPRPEECNNFDDDCDGRVDESDGGGFLRRDCSNACGSGEEECEAGQWLHCSAPQPIDELPNGFDDDCDGFVDEELGDCVHGQTRPCGTDEGECEPGVQHCEHGVWGPCQISYDPAEHPEVCDGLDNDCDGDIDEGCSCEPDTSRPCGTDEGECRPGTQTCSEDGQWLPECVGAVEPVTESCDGRDDNCDGVIDGVASSGFRWSVDSYEPNETCTDAARIFNASGRAEIDEGAGWVGLSVDDPTALTDYPTIHPMGDEDWYAVRVVEGDRGFCWPWTTACSYVLRVQLTLLDREVLDLADQRPEDYRLCVSFGDCAGSLEQFCTHLDDWLEDYSAYLLTLIWGAGCGDASRDVKIRVHSPTGAACGYYQLSINFSYDDSVECP